MDGLGPGALRGGEDRGDVQIAADVAQTYGLIGLADVQRVAIGFGVNGDARGAHFSQSADDAAGDGSAIGNENFVEYLSPNHQFHRSWIISITRIV